MCISTLNLETHQSNVAFEDDANIEPPFVISNETETA